MALWSEGLKKYKKDSNSSAESSPIVEEQVTNHAVSARKEIDWEERHFQICLALLSRTEIGLRGTTNDPRMHMIIRNADMMVELLKEHHEEMLSGKQSQE